MIKISGTTGIDMNGASIIDASSIEGVSVVENGVSVANETQLGLKANTADINVANSSLVKTALNASGTAPVYAYRAKVVFNGTGTVAIKSSGNVSSITDNGVGIYRVNTTVALPADYNCQVSCDRVSTAINSPIFINYYNKQANYIDIYTTIGDRTAMVDTSDISVVLG